MVDEFLDIEVRIIQMTLLILTVYHCIRFVLYVVGVDWEYCLVSFSNVFVLGVCFPFFPFM